MNVLFLLSLVLVAVLIVAAYRRQRDRDMLAEKVRERGGEVVRVTRVRRGHPFPDSGRGWWAWRVEWKDRDGEHTSWALTTREGIQDWRD